MRKLTVAAVAAVACGRALADFSCQLVDPLEWTYVDSKVGDRPAFAETDVPFGAGKIRIEVDGLPELTREGARFGLLTVKRSVGDEIASRLSVARPRVRGLTKRLVREDVGDETRFYLDYKESGCSVILR